MPRVPASRLAVAGLLSLFAALPAGAIEMFTYFGDGSRIGLPSLEVPVQAYPGIPLRSDRIRARSRAQQPRRQMPPQASGTAAGGVVAPRPAPGRDGGPGIPGGGITIRPMPRQEGFGGANGPSSPPADVMPQIRESQPRFPQPIAPQARGSVARPEPVAPPREAPLPGFSQPVFPSGR